jgi:hypothetical protein
MNDFSENGQLWHILNLTYAYSFNQLQTYFGNRSLEFPDRLLYDLTEQKHKHSWPVACEA